MTPQEILVTFSERLRATRLRQSLSQEELVALTDLSISSITSWERAKNLPSIENLVTLANALRVTPGWLLGENPAKVTETVYQPSGAYIFHEEDRPSLLLILREPTLRVLLEELSAYRGEHEEIALHHLTNIIQEIRRRKQPATLPAGKLGEIGIDRDAEKLVKKLDQEKEKP